MSTDSTFSVRKLWAVIALVLVLAWTSSYGEVSPEGPDIPYFDKIAHFFVFGLMGTLCYRCIPRMPWSRTRWLAALAFVLAYGVIDEWIQSHNSNRSSDVLDWLADASGAFTAIAVYRFWTLYRRVLESRFGDLVRGRLTD
jgi:VanZ family protein